MQTMYFKARIIGRLTHVKKLSTVNLRHSMLIIKNLVVFNFKIIFKQNKIQWKSLLDTKLKPEI